MLRNSEEEKDSKTKTPRDPLAAIITKSTLKKRLPGVWGVGWGNRELSSAEVGL